MTHANNSSMPLEPGSSVVVAAPGMSSSPMVEPDVVDGVDVDAVARAVRACAGVSDLYSGRFGEIGSYLPGRRVVAGVQVGDDLLTVQVKARWGYSPRDILTQISGVTAPLRHGRMVNLVVADIDDDPSLTADSSSTVASAAASPVAAIAPPPNDCPADPRRA